MVRSHAVEGETANHDDGHQHGPASATHGFADELRRDRGRIAFTHEAFFDYAYAQRHMSSGLSLPDILRSSEQHLFRRAQVDPLAERAHALTA